MERHPTFLSTPPVFWAARPTWPSQRGLFSATAIQDRSVPRIDYRAHLVRTKYDNVRRLAVPPDGSA